LRIARRCGSCPVATRVEASDRAERQTLSTFRASLTSGVAAVGASPDVKKAARAAVYDAHAADAARAAAYAAAAADAADAVNSARTAAYRANAAAAYADTALSREQMMVEPITLPPELEALIDTATVTPAGAAPVWKDVISGDGPWTFWARWYAAAMAGDPLPWDLQEQIALIPNDIWDAGPEAVAEEIARIEAAYELRQRIAEVEGNQVLSEGQRHGIGGNNPPVEIDDPQTAEQVVVIWESIAGLKEEVEADEPDADRVGRLVDRLAGALSLVMAWCARKADLAVDTTIKWGIPATGGYFILNPAKAEAVLAAAKAWLPFLAP
jgi:hypothetical protein